MTDLDLLSDKEINKHVELIFKHMKEEYQRKNPCPKCGSHNVQIDIDWISGADMQGREWCNDCGWKKITSTKQPEEE